MGALLRPAALTWAGHGHKFTGIQSGWEAFAGRMAML